MKDTVGDDDYDIEMLHKNLGSEQYFFTHQYLKVALTSAS